MTDPAIPARGLEYRRTQATNARGQITGEVFGNGVSLTASYQPQTGQLTGLRYASASTPLRQLDYGYDVFGNLRRQTLNAGQTQEQYQYDALHRMVSATRTGAATGSVHYAYDSAGNFSLKSDFSAAVANAYVYTGGHCGGGANAVKSVQLASGGTRTYCYDANGNLTGDSAGLSLHYDHQNLPVIAHRGNAQDGFRYGADGLRTRSWGSDGARVYLPGYEHRTDTGQTKTYVGDYAVITHTPQAGGTPTRKVEYLLKDRLGSVDAVADSSGTVIETRGYDAFGKPRSGTWTDLTPPKLGSTAVTPKGFTQHEHLNQLELIHMNGRVYDYTLGRFTGVDPFIQFPLNSQSLNPYSYILNNPLSGTDATGYVACIGQLLCDGSGSRRPFGDNGPGDFRCLSSFCKFALGGNSAQSQSDAHGGGTWDKPGSSKVSSQSDIGNALSRENVANKADGDDSALDGAGKSFADMGSALTSTIGKIGIPVIRAIDYAVNGEDSSYSSFKDAIMAPTPSLPTFDGSDTTAGDIGYRATQVVVNVAGIAAGGRGEPAGRAGAAGRAGGEVADTAPTMRQSAANADNLPVVWDGEFATRQLLGTTTTPAGRQINWHAADRMVNPPNSSRAPMSLGEVDQVLDGATRVVKRTYNPLGDTLTLENANMPGRPKVVVDEATGNRVITVINPSKKR